MIRRLPAVLLLAACSTKATSTTDPVLPATPATQTISPEASVICRTDAEVRAALGTTCTVIGTYELEDITNAKGEVVASWPVVRLNDGRAVMIESVWDSSKRPDEATLARFRGKSVSVTGTLRPSPPSPGRPANMSFPCVSPVEKVDILD